MAAGGEKTGDLYAVLGLKKECSTAELRNAYKKLALRWHPDRCSASGNSKFVQEAKEKFQLIQEAYSVLSDFNKRFLYDAGVLYDDDVDDDENGMGDFLGEMAQMMSQTKPGENRHESFEELQQLFVDMFQADLDVGFGGPAAGATPSSPSPSPSWIGNSCGNKRSCSVMNSEGEGEEKGKLDELNTGPGGFCYGSNDSREPLKGSGGGHSKRRSGRQQKVSSKHDVSSRNATISF